MKKLLFILLIPLVFSCSSITSLHKTKIYVGKYLLSSPQYECTRIITTDATFLLDESPTVPDSAWCYVIIDASGYDFHPDIAWKLNKQFFTWEGTAEKYRIRKNIKF